MPKDCNSIETEMGARLCLLRSPTLPRSLTVSTRLEGTPILQPSGAHGPLRPYQSLASKQLNVKCQTTRHGRGDGAKRKAGVFVCRCRTVKHSPMPVAALLPPEDLGLPHMDAMPVKSGTLHGVSSFEEHIRILIGESRLCAHDVNIRSRAESVCEQGEFLCNCAKVGPMKTRHQLLGGSQNCIEQDSIGPTKVKQS